jgi:Glycosyltransferase family 87
MTSEQRTRPTPWAALAPTAVIVWAILLGVVAVRTVAQPNSHDCYKPFYEPAGLNWLHGVDLYQETTATCRYCPLANAFFALLALTPSTVGGLAWRGVNTAAFLGGLFWWLRVYAPPTWTTAQRAAVYLIVMPLAASTINCAQANPLLTGLLLAGTAAAGRERWNWAAVFIAAACLLKIYPIALALLFIVAFPRRFLPRFLIALAAGLALPFVLQDPWWVARQHVGWWTSLCIDDRTQWPLERSYRDLWLIIRCYQLPVSYNVYVVIQLAIAAGIAGVCVAARWWAARPRLEVLNAGLGLAVCWMTVCGPTTEGGGYILLAPTLAWACLECWHGRWPLWICGLVMASAAAFAVAELVCMGSNAGILMGYGPHPIGGLLLLAALACESIRRMVSHTTTVETAAPAPPSARAA